MACRLGWVKRFVRGVLLFISTAPLLIAVLFLISLVPRTIGITQQEQRIVHFERNKEELEAVVREALSADLHEIHSRAWWKSILDPPPQEHKPLYRAMRRAKVWTVYKFDESTRMTLLVGVKQGSLDDMYFGYKWLDDSALQPPEYHGRQLDEHWFLYRYLDDF